MAPILEEDRLPRLHQLEIKRHSSIHQAELINRDEEGRRLKLRILQLQEKSELLQSAAEQKDARISEFTNQERGLRTELQRATVTTKSQDAKMKKQAMELTTVKAEMEALNNTVNDNGKTLQEKFALMRELSRLKPEVEHLQSQLSSHQAVVAEKNELRRLVDSLEVELESEKRAKQKKRVHEESGALSELRSQTEEAERSVVMEKKEKEKLKKLHEKEIAEANTRNEKLEEQLSTWKEKTKNLRAELKQVQAELLKCKDDLERANSVSRAQPSTSLFKPEVAKRLRAQQRSTDDMATIGTPGHEDLGLNRASKKRVPEQAIAGEKSTFSITPFLNRSKNPAEDDLDVSRLSNSPAEELSKDTRTGAIVESSRPDEEAGDLAHLKESDEHPENVIPERRPLGLTAAGKKGIGRPKTKLLAKASIRQPETASEPPDADLDENPGAMPVVSIIGTGSEVRADSSAVSKGSRDSNVPIPALSTVASTASLSEMDEKKKKKRKLVGGGSKSLFDEDGEEESLTKPLKDPLDVRKRKNMLGAGKSAFAVGGFSPLKRDRRGVGKSFLA